MKTLKAIWILILSLLVQIIIFTPRIVIFSIKIIESVLKIVRELLTFLMKQIKYEVLNPYQDAKTDEKLQERAKEVE